MNKVTKQPFKVTVVTLFAEFFESPMRTSLLGKAVDNGALMLETVNPRDFTSDKHRTVDDAPYGGGPGMVLMPNPVVEAIEEARRVNPTAPVVLLSPQGGRFDAASAEELAAGDGVTLVCGRYEGFDERIRAFVDRELSVGDYVLSGGEPAALIIIDAVFRCLPGALGNAESTSSESFTDGLLEYPQYTRPAEFRGLEVPEILLSGNHGRIEDWRRRQALERTKHRRPDLIEQSEDNENATRASGADATRSSGLEKEDGRETNN